MKQRVETLLKILKSPVVIVWLVSLVLIALNLVVAYHTRPFDSDDVSWQNILLTWRPFDGHTVYLASSDNFILKVPFYIVFGHFFGAGRKLLLLESVFFAMLTFSLFYFSALYFLRKLKIPLRYQNLLPFLWFASFGYAIAQLYLNSILRNFEIGLSFAYFVLAAKLYYRQLDPFRSLLLKVSSLIICLLAGALIYNDPYFLYFTILPIVVLYGALYVYRKVTRKQLLTIIGLTVLSILFSKLVEMLAIKSGVSLLFKIPVQFVSFDQLFSNISLVIHGTLVLFGADFFGRKAIDVVTLVAFLNLAILGFILYRGYALRDIWSDKKSQLSPYKLWASFFTGLIAFVLIVDTLSSLTVDLETYRYLIIIAFAAVLFLVFTLGALEKGKMVLVGLLCAATIGNVGTFFVATPSAQAGAAGNQANAENLLTINALAAQGLTKGYTPYWDGTINTYLSRGSIQFLPIICSVQRTEPLHFLIDSTQLTRGVTQSFYIIDPDLNFPPTCTTQQVLKQFGQPEKSLRVADKTVLIYNYDLITKM